MRRIVASTLLLLACSAPHAADADVPLGPLPRSVTPEHVALELRMDASAESFSGKVDIDVSVNESVDTIWLHGRDLDIDSAALTTASGETIPLKASVAHAAGGVMKFVAPTTLATGKAKLSIAYRAKFDQRLQGAYQIKVGDDRYIASQMEPLGARGAFPSFDEPAFKTPWDVTLIVPIEQNAVANTAQIAKEKVQDGWKKLRFATTEKLPSYLIAFAVGPWDKVEWQDIPPNAIRKTPLKLRGIAPKGRGGEMDYALEHTAAQVAALENYFAIPYPFDKLDLLAAPDFSFGAMENAGLIVYRESLLLGVDKASTQQRQGYWATHTHELAHQWFGNLVTMPWWDDVWLNEAFASWMEARILSDLQPGFRTDRDLIEEGIRAMDNDSLASARRIHEPVHDYTGVLSAFDGITYSKGAAVLAMFESYLGRDKFRDAIRMHLRKFARGNATSGDLVRAIAAQGADPSALQAAFVSFTDQAGVPLLRTQLQCESGKATLKLQQSRYLPLGSTASVDVRWGIPVCVRYPGGRGGAPGATVRQCTLLSEPQGEMLLATDSCPPWVHPNADGAGYYRFAPAAADQRALAAFVGKLSDFEQRVYADSVIAGYESGLLSTEDFLRAVEMFSKAADRTIVLAPKPVLAWLRDAFPTNDTQRETVERFTVAVYSPRLTALGLDAGKDDSDEIRLLRQDLITLLADLPPAEDLRSTLAARGRAVLGLDKTPPGPLNLDAVSSDQRGVVLRLAAILGGQPEFDAMKRHLTATQDARLRRDLLTALGEFRDPMLAQRARELSLEPGIRAGEILTVAYAQGGVRESRAAMHDWVRANFETLFKKVPQVWQARLPALEFAGECSTAAADTLQSRYADRMRTVEGGPRALAQATETLRLCAARLDHYRASGFGKALQAAR